jgi:L-malate glycosyltransferase
MKRRIIFFHVLNDYSGSPNVLSTVIRGLLEKGFAVDLYTSSATDGPLGGIEGVNYHPVFYRIFKNKILTSILIIIVQIRYFLSVLQFRKEDDVQIYVNTILPFGATLGAQIVNKKVVYHVHENPIRKNIFHKVGIYILLKYADKAIFVSEDLYNSYKFEKRKKVLIYNSLTPQFINRAKDFQIMYTKPEKILMACSLRIYKGVNIFVELAERLPEFKFLLVLNADESEIEGYFEKRIIPQNLEIFSKQTDMHPFYTKAQLVLNLSLPEMWVETFGLTILEGMTYGIPAIVPPVGGITELVENGINGFKVDPGDLKDLIDKINLIFSNEELYFKLSAGARSKADQFSYAKMIHCVEEVLK